MWIRSQNKKKLVKLKNIKIEHYTSADLKKVFDGCFIQVDEAGGIGDYSSEEKAIKVLDVIQTIMHDAGEDAVFIMPQDEEVK